jgi:hypothetical protein
MSNGMEHFDAELVKIEEFARRVHEWYASEGSSFALEEVEVKFEPNPHVREYSIKIKPKG